MICFRDQSFCAESSECANTECNRRWTDELAYQANRWLFLHLESLLHLSSSRESEMNDRELLELAAKAAQIMVNPWHEKYGLLLSDFDFEPWNPLTDDGDALRLAVKLKIGSIWALQQWGNENMDDADSAYEQDPYAATRRAIVRAAAEIGKEMK